MPLEYDLEKRLKDLVPVLDEYTEWFMQVLRRISYPAGGEERQTFSKPESFMAWLEMAGQDSSMNSEITGRIETLHNDLSMQADTLINESMKHGKPPEYAQYDSLVTLFEEFTIQLRRLEKDFLLSDHGMDAETGLRSADLLKSDLDRELERLARHGKPFSIALVRIDNYAKMKESLGEDKCLRCVQLVADFIKKSLRSFDDAYRLEADQFVLALKQAGSAGGVKALERLKTELEAHNTGAAAEDADLRLTLSSCIGEPIPGDDLGDLLENLKQDLKTFEQEEGTVLEHFEMSPLQRYIKEVQD